MSKILILDDDPSLRSMFEDLLTTRGHSVIAAADGDTALKILRAGLTDLLITDIIMPGKDGVEVISAVRREFRRLRIIAISGADPSGPHLCSAAEAGANALLPKPFLPAALFYLVDLVLTAATGKNVETKVTEGARLFLPTRFVHS